MTPQLVTPLLRLACPLSFPTSMKWLVGRNIRGSTQLIALRRLDSHLTSVTRNVFQYLLAELHALATTSTRVALLSSPIDTLRISDSLIDKNLGSATPWLNPWDPSSRTWARAFWKAWWTQDSSRRQSLSPPQSYRLALHRNAFDHSEKHLPEAVHAVDGCQPGTPSIRTVDEGVRALMVCGDEQVTTEGGQPNPRFPGEHAGMQDTDGAMPLSRPLLDTSTLAGVATLVCEKTAHVPHRMTLLWHGTSSFAERFSKVASCSSTSGVLRVPSLWTRRRMAVGIGERAPVPLSL